MAPQFSFLSLSGMLRKKRTARRKSIPDDDITLKDYHSCALKLDVDDIILQMSKGDPTKMGLTNYLKRQLAEINHTPDHPVYFIMIQEAIKNLNEKEGSTSDAISEFILGKYDVIKVVHMAKLVDQLRKLASTREIILTSENRYKVPDANATDDGNLKLVEQGLSMHEQDEQGYEPCNSKEVVYLLGGLNELNGNQCQTVVGEMKNRIIGSQLEQQDVRVFKPCTVEGHMPEDQNRINESQYDVQFQNESLNGCPLSQVADSICQDNLQEEQTPEVIDLRLDDELSEPPGYEIEGFESRMPTQDERIVTMAGGKIIEVNEGIVQVTDEVARCGLQVNQVNDERDAEEVQHRYSWEETLTTEFSQEKGQAPKEAKDKMQHVGSLPALLPSKDNFTAWRRGIETMERELREMIDHLSSVDVPEHVISLSEAELFTVPESDSKTVSISADTSKDSVQHMWNGQIGDNLTKQKEQAKACSREEVLKSDLKLVVSSAESLFMNLEQLTMIKRQYLSSSVSSFEVGSQKLSECKLVRSASPPGPLECPRLDLEHQFEPGMMERQEKMELSESLGQNLDNNSQQKHVECDLAIITSDAVNPEAANNLAGTWKRKRKWKHQQPTRTGLRPRDNGRSHPDETKPESLQPKHACRSLDEPKCDTSQLQIRRRGRPSKEKAAT